MNKTDREYFEQRVNGIVKCTNGTIATILNREKKGTGLTATKKYSLITKGQATPKTENEILKVSDSYKDTNFDTFLKCFDYPLTELQKQKIAFNKTIDQRTDELMQEVELEGKRLIDKAVLGLIEAKDIPNALHNLGEMANLARKTKLKVAI